MRSGAGYVRVSTGKQEELSPDAQKRLIMEYAKAHDIHITEEHIFIENGISGKSADRRPAFQKMIALAKSKPKPFDVILLWKFSRFARNQDESILYKNLLRNKCGIDIISISEPIADGMFGQLIERIIEWNDEFYSYNLSGEVKRGMTEKALRGGYQSRPPLGYRIECQREPLVIVPEEASIIRLIFEKYVKHHSSIHSIVTDLHALGYKTSQGKDFERRSIEYILQNPTYIGNIRWNRTESATNLIKDKEDWILAKGSHPSIISEEWFEAAGKRFESEYHTRGERPASVCKHWLSGLLKCPDCSRSLSACSRLDKVHNKRYWNFQCCGYSKGKCFVSHQISELKIAPAVTGSVKKVMHGISPGYTPIRTDDVNKERSLLEKQLERLIQKERRMKDAYLNGIDTLLEYQHQKELLCREHNRLERCLNDTNKAHNEDTDYIMLKPVDTLSDLILNDHCTSQQKNEAMKSIITRILYRKEQQQVEIHYFLPSLGKHNVSAPFKNSIPPCHLDDPVGKQIPWRPGL